MLPYSQLQFQQQVPPTKPTNQRDVTLAIHRQEEMRHRIKSISALSQSTAVTSAFAPSIPSKRGQRSKGEFHSRARTPFEGPPPLELADLTQGVGVKQELRSNREAEQRRLHPSYWQSRGTAAQQQEENAKWAKHESPTATHILDVSRKVETFNNNLSDSKKKLNAQVRVPSSAVVEDDRRTATQTHRQRQRANFLKGVLNSGGGVRKQRPGSATSLAASLRDQMPVVPGRADEEGDMRSPSPTRTAQERFRPLLERETVTVTNTIRRTAQQGTPPREREIDAMLSARRLRVQQQSVPPTAMTSKTCSSFNSYKKFVASSKKAGAVDLDQKLNKMMSGASDDGTETSLALRTDLAHVASRRTAILKKAQTPTPKISAAKKL